MALVPLGEDDDDEPSATAGIIRRQYGGEGARLEAKRRKIGKWPQSSTTGNTTLGAGDGKFLPVRPGQGQIPGLNTLGISLGNQHRATEILTVLQGTLQVGFVISSPKNRLITKVLKKFPIGLVHYQRNVGYGSGVAIVALSSQNTGVISIANAVFGSEPDIDTYVLAKAFQVDKSVTAPMQSKF
nr:putative germin-like protein 2-3 [Nicotiana tomentosiformis]